MPLEELPGHPKKGRKTKGLSDTVVELRLTSMSAPQVRVTTTSDFSSQRIAENPREFRPTISYGQRVEIMNCQE